MSRKKRKERRNNKSVFKKTEKYFLIEITFNRLAILLTKLNLLSTYKKKRQFKSLKLRDFGKDSYNIM